MPEDERLPKILHTDPEHGGLRFVVILVLIFTIIIAFLLTQLLLNLVASETRLIEFATVLSCALAFPLAFAITWVVEVILKREWHSGKTITLDEGELTYRDTREDIDEAGENGQPVTINWSKRVNALYWYFKLSGFPRAGRERRVSKNWYGLACQLQQDDSRLIIYCYLPPNQAERWIDDESLSDPFIELSLAELYTRAGQKRRSSASTRPKIDPGLLTGTEGRYWLAEQKRWGSGLELTQKDFAYFIQYVEQNIGLQA